MEISRTKFSRPSISRTIDEGVRFLLSELIMILLARTSRKIGKSSKVILFFDKLNSIELTLGLPFGAALLVRRCNVADHSDV